MDGNRLHSKANGQEWRCGRLETPSLAQLREQARQNSLAGVRTTVREVVADVQALHGDASNEGAMFQVASQFNLLEMVSPSVVPEDGVGIYERDFTQGPACAIAAGAGTIYRNYFANVNGKIGQTSNNQIDCLAEIGNLLGNSEQRLWEMVNGYALPSAEGLKSITERLNDLHESERDELRAALRVGLHLDTQVTLNGSSHVVSQAYCSAMPVSYSRHSADLWAPFAILILEAAYEATLCASIANAARTENHRLFLTLLGGGAFGNELPWIHDAIQRAITLYPDCGLDIAIVSYGQSKPTVQRLIQTLSSTIRDRTNG